MRHEKLEDAVREFVSRFDQIPSQLLVDAMGDEQSYDNPKLELVAGGQEECPECGSTDVEEREVAFDENDEPIRDDADIPVDPEDAEGREYTEERHICTFCGYVGNPDEENQGFHKTGSEYGFPVAWSTLFHDRDGCLRSDERKAAAVKAGFMVFESEYFDSVLLGVDGAGYDFYEQHWTQLYKELGLKWHKEDATDAEPGNAV